MRANVNELRKMLEAGQIAEADLSGMTISGRLGAAPQATPAPAFTPSEQEAFFSGGERGALPMGSMRNEETGRVTYFRPGGGFGDKPYPADAGRANAAQRTMRVVGADGSSMFDLGEEPAREVPIDYSRPPVLIAGLGKGHYTADGRSAIVTGPDGSKTRVVLGYDRAASQKATATDLAIQRARSDLEHQAEQTGLLRDKRAMLAAGPAQTTTDALPQEITQKQLEARYGKPDKGMRWTADGRLEPLPGGEVEESARIALEKARESIAGIDAMIGKRNETGALLDGSAPHPGFSKAVGFGFPRWAQLSGTDARDFTARLDQLKGGAFLEAFDSLKGGGQITEVEGKKATDAITRMNDAQSESEFIKAASEFRTVLERGLARAQGKLGGGRAAAALPSADGLASRSRALFEARAAIRAGAPRDAVISRLRQMGVTEEP